MAVTDRFRCHRRRCCWVFVLGLTCAWITPGFAQQSDQLRTAVECHPRAGVPNFKAKIDSKRAVKIAYLGGSITAAPGWRVMSREWFARQYPEAKFEEINAAIPGTGSDLGVFRLQNDVLRHQPDLLFVEFAVNDESLLPAQIYQSMEGIVRQTWRSNPKIDICFVYTVNLPSMTDLRAGKMQRSASAMEAVAEHYHIPSIHFGVKVAQLEMDGQLVFKAPKPDNFNTLPMVFCTDGTHPYAQTGHKIYAETVARSWPSIRDATGTPADHPLPAPLRSDNWEQARQVAITPQMLQGGWKKLTAQDPLAKQFQHGMPVLFQASQPGAVLEFSFEGTTVAIFDLLGADGGQLKVQIDDAEPHLVTRFDRYCTYYRISKLDVSRELPAGHHRVRIELTPEALDKRRILSEQNRADFDQHPEKYSSNTWYIGSVLLVGRLTSDADGKR